MEDEHTEDIRVRFLNHPDTQDLFASLDYMLKDGVHFQREGSQAKYYNYIYSNEDSLRAYYQYLFSVELTFGGTEASGYYFLDFIGSTRGKIDASNRHHMKSEYVIIGFIIYKIFFIDNQIDVVSVKDLQKKIRIDYEGLKPGIYRLIAKSRNTNPGNLNDDAIDATVESALREFKKIGWVTLNDDDFDLLPAFDRLIAIHEDLINNLDETLNELR
ncbi:hypothetical protein [Cellulophaga sp. Hel_I_12]|uniref:condensin complex protein MksE n=1 Tax=Cellulophaga sp. Hel_I_12 TaxID=1249972 RepID=UPI000647293E|nr:hypothetical protein [Cellulophaga sp. Hel_I_12]